MKLIDPSLIISRLRVIIENFSQAANQSIYIENAYRFTHSPARCMVNRLHDCINELCQLIRELEPQRGDAGCLTLEEALTLEGYAEIRRGLVISWQFVESRERAIFQQAANRIPDQARPDND